MQTFITPVHRLAIQNPRVYFPGFQTTIFNVFTWSSLLHFRIYFTALLWAVLFQSYVQGLSNVFSHLIFSSYSKKENLQVFFADHLQTWHEENRCTYADIYYFMITVITGSKFLGWKRKKRILGSSGKSLGTERVDNGLQQLATLRMAADYELTNLRLVGAHPWRGNVKPAFMSFRTLITLLSSPFC